MLGRLGREISAHPLRSAIAGGLALVCLGLILTTTLPMALARRVPGLALRLDANNSVALVTQALNLRDEMLSLLPPVQLVDQKPVKDDRDLGLDARTERSERIKQIKFDMADLAKRAIAADPLDATAYRLMAETSSDRDETRRLMTEAFARSRHETAAAFWLLNAAYERHDPVDIADKADVLLKTRRQLDAYTLSYFYTLIGSEEGRAQVVKALVAEPRWRSRFFLNARLNLSSPDDMLKLFLALKAAGSPASGEEVTPFLENSLAQDGDIVGIYNTWLQLLPEDALGDLRPVNNIDFSSDPNGTPFDWRFPKRTNVSLTLSKDPDGGDQRILGVHFPIGRIVFGGVEQVVFLRPGSYRFTAQFSGNLASKRGMRWTVACYGNPDRIGASDQLLGQQRGWQVFIFDFTVPDDGSCGAQNLRLVHDSRSPSEEYATGDVNFRKLNITRLADPAD